METKSTKCLIIGSGPAGYTAAIYTSRANLSPILYEGIQPGGQLTTTTEIENFPGYPNGVSGTDMMADLRAQAARYGADIRPGIVTEADFSQRPFTVKISDGSVITAETVIIATGASARYLELPGEQRLRGMGVSACATCDGFFYRKKRVAVVGGGDTACEEALYLSNLASEVYLIVRRDRLRASKVMQQRVTDNPNITVLFNTNTVDLEGDEYLEAALLVENVGTPEERRYRLPLDGFFLAIGHIPNTKAFGSQINTDHNGYIVTAGYSTATNVPGVFAAGDVADPHYRQAITAAASGCRAAIDADRFLLEE